MNKGVKTASGDVVYLKTSFEVDDKIEEFYTGGSVHVCNDGERVFTMCGSAVKVLSVESGRVEHNLEEEEDVVTCFAMSPDSQHLVIAWRSLLLKQYDWKNEKITHSWRGHLGPVVSMAFDSSSTLVATGSSDSTIKVWDCVKHYCTHNLRGSKGIVTLVSFHPDSEAALLFSSSSIDCKIRVWSLQSSKCIRELSGHVSAVTSLGVALTGDTLLSAGRDKVVQVWDLSSGTIRKTIPVFESVEGMVLLPSSLQHDETSPKRDAVVFATAGDKGTIRVWSTTEASPLHCLEPLSSSHEQLLEERESREEKEDSRQVYVGLHYCQRLGAIVGVTSDHNIIMYSIDDGYTQLKQFIGYLDEVLDMRFVGNSESLLAVATNTDQVKVFDRSSCNCQLLSGHTGIILCIDASADGQLLVTSSKDNSIRVWSYDSQSGLFHCVAMGTGHTHAVGAVAISRLKKSFVVSGSQDCTIKMWSWKSLNAEGIVRLKVKFTQIAHKKDINALDVSPNDKLIVSGSQDKTAMIWRVSDGSLLGSLKGHRRGVWSVKFSPVDQCIATASGDSTIKIWAISDFACVKTFEGHTNSVLKVIFLSRGMQLASCGSDGLVKVWTIRSNECVATLDQHTEKIWSLACCNDGNLLVSGGADSLVCYWKDVSQEVEAKQVEEKERLILQEQELSNLLHQKNYVKAVGLAITLDQPYRVSQILQELYDDGGPEGKFTETILQLREDQIHVLLKFLNKWNTNARSSCLAQQTLSVVLKSTPVEKLTQVEEIKKIVDGLVPYTERHFARLSRLQQLSMFMEYTRQCMSLPTATTGGLDERESKECDKMEVEPIIREKQNGVTQTPDSTEDLEKMDEEGTLAGHYDNGSENHVTSTTKVKKVSKRIQRKTKLKEKLSRRTN